MEEGLLVVRLDGSVQAFDSVAERLLDLPAGSLRIGALLTDYVDSDELRHLLSQGHERSGDGPLSFADLPISPNGCPLLLRWTCLSDHVAEAPSLLLKVRSPETGSDADTARALVSRLSRELRAPVAAIRGCSATLLGGALDELERARRFVEMVQHNAGQLEEIADDLNALAQVERSWIEQHSSAVDVGSLLGLIARRVGEEGAQRGVAVRALLPELRLPIAAVPQLLEQSLLGVLSELLRAAKSGEEISCELLEGDDERTAQITMKRRSRSGTPGRGAGMEESSDASSIRMATVRDVVRGHAGRVSFEYASGRLEGVRLHWPLWKGEGGAKLEWLRLCYVREVRVNALDSGNFIGDSSRVGVPDANQARCAGEFETGNPELGFVSFRGSSGGVRGDEPPVVNG